jgi:hypothetical protein
MKTDSQSVLLLCAGGVFFVYLVTRMVTTPRVPRDQRFFDARQRIADAKRRARDTSAPPAERAAALRDAAVAALEGLRRPGLAASYAQRAERLDPSGGTSAAGLLGRALRQGEKYRALERILWRCIADRQAPGADQQRAFDELVGLYEGPLNRPEMAEGLRQLKAAAPVSGV